MTAANCEKHPFELAETICYDCGYDACKTCLVYARGLKKPAICLDCSITAAGVRRTSARPPKYIGKDMKVLRKRLAREHKEQRAAASRLVDFDQIPPFDPATDLAPDEGPFEPIAEPAFEPIAEPAFEPDAEPSLEERIAPGLPPIEPEPAFDGIPAMPQFEPEPALNGAPADASQEQMPQMDWSQDWSDDWNTPPVATGN